MANHGVTIPAILFVCLGNICRSPMAEGAFCAIAARAGLECRAASAGTASYHLGEPPDPRAIAIAKENGVDISGIAARQIEVADFHRFTHILALDKANLAGIKARRPRDGSARVGLLLDAVVGREGETVKDPYYGDEADFRRAWEDVALAASALVERFLREGHSARF